MKLNPEHQFVPTREHVGTILADYGATLHHLENSKSGVENTTLLLATSLGDCALRVYRQHKKDDAAIENETAFMQHLRSADIPVPEIIHTTTGASFTRANIGDTSWQAVLMELAKGKHAEHYTPPLVSEMAELQARMHEASTRFTPPQPGRRIQHLDEQPFITAASKNVSSRPELAPFIQRAQAHTVLLPDDTPYGFCHLDLDKGNLLVNETGNISGVLDFDDTQEAPLVMDVAHAMWAVRYFGGRPLMDRYRSHYESRRPMDKQEQALLPAIMLFRHYLVSSMFIAGKEPDAAAAETFLTIEDELQQMQSAAST